MTVDRARAEAAVAELLRALGEDPDGSRLAGTPARVVTAAAELLAGASIDAAAILAAEPPVAGPAEGPVVLRGVRFRSTCEHHLLPFRGTAAIVYLPGERLAGLGTLVRVVGAVTSRLQVQERLTAEIADAVEEGLGARGVLVLTTAAHACVWARGPRAEGTSAVVVAARGRFREGAGRQEALLLALGPAGDGW